MLTPHTHECTQSHSHTIRKVPPLPRPHTHHTPPPCPPLTTTPQTPAPSDPPPTHHTPGQHFTGQLCGLLLALQCKLGALAEGVRLPRPAAAAAATAGTQDREKVGSGHKTHNPGSSCRFFRIQLHPTKLKRGPLNNSDVCACVDAVQVQASTQWLWCWWCACTHCVLQCIQLQLLTPPPPQVN